MKPRKKLPERAEPLCVERRPEDEGPQSTAALDTLDGQGIWAKAPAYLECRFTAQSAAGTWPAFWTITHLDRDQKGDELDIVEAYGGNGKGNPNHPGYSIVGHFWEQNNPDGTKKKHPSPVAKVMGGKSYWSRRSIPSAS